MTTLQEMTADTVEPKETTSADPWVANDADPIEQDEEGWWFWDEVWVHRHGPWATEGECLAQLTAYAATI